MNNKYCQFNQNIHYDDGNIMWSKDRKYLITFETDSVYFFDEPMVCGIGKETEGSLYNVVEEE